MKTFAIVFAAGKGTRMKTELPKCAFPILKKPMIEYIIENVERSNIDETVLVVGHKKEIFEDMLADRVVFAYQHEQLGTGHAAQMTESYLKGKQGNTIILLGDMPLISDKVIDKILVKHEESNNDLTVVTTNFDNPKGYGRIVRDQYGKIASIVEHNDCNHEQKQIKEVNTGIYVVNNTVLFDVLPKITMNPRKKEYYLTDIVELMKPSYKIGTFVMRDSFRVMGVNDLFAISVAEKYMREEINKMHMLNGVSIVNPETVTIGHNVTIEPAVTIQPNTTITGKSIIKKDAVIGPNTEIHNSVIYEKVTVKHSLVYDSTVNERSMIGPFAHLRNNAIIGKGNRIGNFVEVKKSSTGENTKAAHLAYIGDTTTGKNVNFGCGSVTVNYDGVTKHQTVIGDDVFIGCNTNLIAPIKIEDHVFIAAGSTVTKDVPKGALAIARNQQINKEDYVKHLIKPKKD